MHLDEEDTWHKYLEKLLVKCNEKDMYRIYPIAINKSALKIQVNGIKNSNYIRLYEIDNSIKKDYLIFSIKHDLCRLMFRIERVDKASKVTKKPVKLF